MKWKRWYFLWFILFYTIPTTFATTELPQFAVSLGNLYLGVRYRVTSNLGTELRYSGFDPEIKVYSGRGYYTLPFGPLFIGYAGLEYGMINFSQEGVTGIGSLVMPYVGLELVTNKQITLVGDVGYANVTLTAAGFTVTGPEWTTNFGINYYFGPLRKKVTAVPKEKNNTTPPPPSPPSGEGESEMTEEEKKTQMRHHFAEGDKYYMEGKFKEAISEWRKVLDFDPNHELAKRKIDKAIIQWQKQPNTK